jgi:hypothetical protein
MILQGCMPYPMGFVLWSLGVGSKAHTKTGDVGVELSAAGALRLAAQFFLSAEMAAYSCRPAIQDIPLCCRHLGSRTW